MVFDYIMEKPEIVQVPKRIHNSCLGYQGGGRYSTPIPRLTISGYIQAKKGKGRVQKKLSLDCGQCPSFVGVSDNTDDIITPRINYVPKINPGKHYRNSSSDV